MSEDMEGMDLSPEEKEQLTAAYQKVFMGVSNAQEGQLVFWDLMNRGYLFRSYNQQNAGAYAMEGKREIALYVMTQVNLSPNVGGIRGAQMIETLKQSMANAERLRKTVDKDD